LVTNGNRGLSHRGNRRRDEDMLVVSIVQVRVEVAVRKTVGCIVISQIWCDLKTIQTTTSSHSSPFHLKSPKQPMKYKILLHNSK